MMGDKNEWVIVGDFDIYGKQKECLIYVCGTDKAQAEHVLDRMLHNPNERDLETLKKAKNIHIEEVEAKYCWWNDPFLCN